MKAWICQLINTDTCGNSWTEKDPIIILADTKEDANAKLEFPGFFAYWSIKPAKSQ